MSTSTQLSITNMRPANAEESMKRALYFCHSVHLCCKRHLQHLMNLGNGGQLGSQVREVIAQGISEWDLASGLKIMTCINIHCTGLGRSEESKDQWLIDFLFAALREADAMFPSPSAEEIIELHGTSSREQMCEDVANHVLNVLGIHTADAAALRLLRGFLSEFPGTGDELLVFALSQPPEALRHHLKTLEC